MMALTGVILFGIGLWLAIYILDKKRIHKQRLNRNLGLK